MKSFPIIIRSATTVNRVGFVNPPALPQGEQVTVSQLIGASFSTRAKISELFFWRLR